MTLKVSFCLLLVTMASLLWPSDCVLTHTLLHAKNLEKSLVYESPEHVKACTIAVQDGHIHKNWPRVIYRLMEFTRVLILASALFGLLPPLLRWLLFHKMWLCRALSTPTISKVPQDTPWASLSSSLLLPTSKAQRAELGEPTSPQIHTTQNSSFALSQPLWQCSLMGLVHSNNCFLLQLLIQVYTASPSDRIARKLPGLTWKAWLWSLRQLRALLLWWISQ